MEWMSELFNNSVAMLQIAMFLLFFAVSVIVSVVMVLTYIVKRIQGMWSYDPNHINEEEE